MCAPRSRITLSFVLAAVLAFGATSCSNNTRTGTAFCQRLQTELPGINDPMESQADVLRMVSRYKRLLDVAPLSIEEDFRVLTRLLEDASKANPNDPESLQDIADAAYAANTSALQVSRWVYDTCAVDIATGMNVAPPRTAPPSTIPEETLAPDLDSDPGSEPPDTNEEQTP